MSPLILPAAPRAGASFERVGMLDGFHWTRVVSKQLRFLYEEITTLPPPPKMKELAEDIDRGLAAASGATASQPSGDIPNAEPAYPKTSAISST